MLVEQRFFVGDRLQVNRIVEPAEAFADAEVIIPYPAAHQWQYDAAAQYRRIVGVITFQVTYRIVADAPGQLSVVHLVEPEFAVQRGRFDDSAGHAAAAQFARKLIIGLRCGQVVDPGAVEDALHEQVAADRLPVEGHVQVAVKDARDQRAGPTLFGQPAEVFDVFDHSLLLRGGVVDHAALSFGGLELAELRLRALFHTRHRCGFQRPLCRIPCLLQLFIRTVLVAEPVAEIGGHRFSRIRIVVDEAPVVPFAVDATRNVHADYGVTLFGL